VSNYSDYPPAAKHLPIVANAQQLDVERILSLKPDLILAWQHGNPPAALAKLASFGLPIFYSDPHSIADIASSIERLGRLTGTQQTATTHAMKFSQHYQQLQQQFQQTVPRRVFLQLWDDPLMTVNGDNLLSKALTICGSHNVFAALPTSIATVSTEAVIAAKPDIILHLGKSSRWENFWLPWQKLPAVKPQVLVTFDDDRLSRFGPRFIDGVHHLCHTLEQV
jgi:iron complex transport system substrate-binding protein